MPRDVDRLSMSVRDTVENLRAVAFIFSLIRCGLDRPVRLSIGILRRPVYLQSRLFLTLSQGGFVVDDGLCLGERLIVREHYD